MAKRTVIFLVSLAIVAGAFSLWSQEIDLEALPPEPGEEAVPLFSLDGEDPPAEVKVGGAMSATPAFEQATGKGMAFPEESIPQGKKLVLRAYEVKEGDWLAKIANQFYGDPSQWRRIWAFNRYIKDPNWIFPGDDLVIPIYEEVTETLEVETNTAKLEETKVAETHARDVFVAPADFKFDGCIAEVKEKKLMTAYGDTVFIDLGKAHGIQPGAKFTIYREGKEIVHPRTGESMGIMVEKIGTLQVTSDVDDSVSAAVIIDSRKPVTVGDFIKSESR